MGGTMIGGCVGLGLVAAFPQDWLMLLSGFALWLAVCTYVATLLRDCRSYGAALSGYTAGIIAVGVIAAPQTALSTTLDRVAAILIGIASVLVMDRLLAGTGAFDTLVAGLRARQADLAGLAADVLEGRPLGDDLPMVQLAAGVAALQTRAGACRCAPPGPARPASADGGWRQPAATPPARQPRPHGRADRRRAGADLRRPGIGVPRPGRLGQHDAGANPAGSVRRIAGHLPKPDPGALGLASADPVFTWVRLARRIPVRIRIDQVPDTVHLALGMTAAVTVGQGAGPVLPHGLLSRVFTHSP